MAHTLSLAACDNLMVSKEKALLGILDCPLAWEAMHTTAPDCPHSFRAPGKGIVQPQGVMEEADCMGFNEFTLP